MCSLDYEKMLFLKLFLKDVYSVWKYVLISDTV